MFAWIFNRLVGWQDGSSTKWRVVGRRWVDINAENGEKISGKYVERLRSRNHLFSGVICTDECKERSRSVMPID